MSATSRALDRAAKFQARIPVHLKDDALLMSVVDQLAKGGTFKDSAWVWIVNYLNTAKTPMKPEQYLKALERALS